ncbi:HlyC/CorC family transporter [Alkalibacter rhizosphaerae]|uniref:HlyC/CorC family transporter n=1 Tax=Alkalibacter rhizosphaerae TaxID=2815577 RepID=A0A974XM89_9FIRM|nr:hemolysin family protein [Alkalibacter rhizosphaerae]QSX08521.1 HlyC/CorC family transporter [Alkalibacter rhizosphaerae]
MIGRLIFLVLLIGVNAYFAASEIALITLNDNKLKRMAEDGNPKAIQLTKLLKEPSGFLATIQIGITLAGFLASAFAAESFADPIVGSLIGWGVPVAESILRVSIVVVITVILSYFTLVFGELVPKRVGMKKAEKIAFFVVKSLVILAKLAHPFVKILTASTNFVVRLFGIDPNAVDDEVTEEEIRMMVDVGEEIGAIDQREKTMINNIFEFNDKTVEEIMTHRMELVGVPSDISLHELMAVLENKTFSRIPVYEGSLDQIIGILHVKDLLSLIATKKEGFDILDHVRKPYFVPVTKKIDSLFLDLQQEKTHMAIVIDEYGGTAGIVTLEDLVEEIVGNIFDEYDRDEDMEFRQVDEQNFEAKGTIRLDELQELIKVELPVDEFETLNGLLISLFGNVLPTGPTGEVRYDNLLMQVMEVSDKRIEKVRIKKTSIQSNDKPKGMGENGFKDF